MENIQFETKTDFIEFLKQNSFETLTYDKLLEIKEEVKQLPELDIPYETIQKLDTAIQNRKDKILSYLYMNNMGYSLKDENGSIVLKRSKTSRKSDVLAIIFGSILSVFGLVAFSIIFQFILGINEQEFSFMTFVLLSFLFVPGGTGIALISRGIIRRNKYKNFLLNINSNEILHHLFNSSEVYSKDQYMFSIILKDNKHLLNLNSSEFDQKNIIEFEFSNKAYLETLHNLTAKLNS